MRGSDRLKELTEYYFSRKNAEITRLEKEGVDVINLGIGSPDLSPHSSVIDTLSLSSQHTENHGYQPYRGTYDLRHSISNWLSREFGTSFNEDEILPLIGSKEGVFHISMAFVNPGDIVAIPELGYPAYQSVSKLIGAKILLYPLNADYLPDWDNMPEEINQAKILWMNYPHMPTGAVATELHFKKAIEWALNNDTLICHDNPYCHILTDKASAIMQIEGARDVALELHSLSKSHNMAGWRVGWINGSKELIDTILKVKSNIDSGMFKGIQDAAITALSLPQSWYQELNSIYQKRQSLAFDILKSLNCNFQQPQSGLFVWGELPDNQDADLWSDNLLSEKGVFITPGYIFGEKGKSYIRVSLCQGEDRLESALKRIKG